MRKHKTIPVFVPHFGCPNNCSFCNQKKITGMACPVTPEMAEKTIEESLKTIDRTSCSVEVGFFGGSFTGIPAREQEALLAAAYRFADTGKIDGIRLSTRPDYIDETVLSRLKHYGVTMVELGVQSMDEDVLRKNLRGHTAEDAVRASQMIRAAGIRLGHQVMLGLPSDNREKALKSVRQLIRLKPDCARIYPTLVIRDTLLAQWYQNGSYTPLHLAEAVDLSKEVLKRFRAAKVQVIRVGLMNSDGIKIGEDVLAGPYHPAFGELVESALVYDSVSQELKKNAGKTLQIAVHPRFVSAFVGLKRENINRWKLDFALKEIRIIQDEQVKYGEWRILCI